MLKEAVQEFGEQNEVSVELAAVLGNLATVLNKQVINVDMLTSKTSAVEATLVYLVFLS